MDNKIPSISNLVKKNRDFVNKGQEVENKKKTNTSNFIRNSEPETSDLVK